MEKQERQQKTLELAWEAVQDIYTTHANIHAYRHGLKTFCSFGENTYLIKISKKKIQAFYDAEEGGKAGELGLQDFLKKEWRNTFKQKSKNAISKALEFTERYHLKSESLSKDQLFDAIKNGTNINNELFVVFAACQTQYASLVEGYIKDRMPKTLSASEKDEVFNILTQSDRETPLLKEEIAWEQLVVGLNKKFSQELPPLEAYAYPELALHAGKYGLLGAADGLLPWSKEFLYKKLLQHKDFSIETKWQEQKVEIVETKKKIIEKFAIQPDIIELCEEVALLGYLRLCLRLQGWMPMAHIIMKEFFPQLPKYLPYTTRQLECCIHTELNKIFDGDRSLKPEELDERFELSLYGLLDGEEVFWSGKKAEEMFSKLVPSIDTQVEELKGQIGWKGKVIGQCFVVRWDSDDTLGEVDKMPEGAVLVAGQTRPQLMAAIKKASAIVTDEGGLLSHAAIVSRELKKPSVIGTKYATKVFQTGDSIEVDAEKGIVRKLK
jgi:phosphohistidine swiveling domain-containing protein